MKKPEPIDEEIILDKNIYIESQTDTSGIITNCNDYFAKISGYSKDELIGKSHNIIRHPDMPRIIFKLLWNRIQNDQNIIAVIKNMAKDGRYYWVFTHFEIIKDINTQKIMGYRAYRKNVSKHITDLLLPLYKKLVEIEKDGGMRESEKYLDDFMSEKGAHITIDNLMEEIHRFY